MNHRVTQVLAGAACAPLLLYARWRRLWRGVPDRPSTHAREIEQDLERLRGGRG